MMWQRQQFAVATDTDNWADFDTGDRQRARSRRRRRLRVKVIPGGAAVVGKLYVWTKS
jgi:hypothetical protein